MKLGSSLLWGVALGGALMACSGTAPDDTGPVAVAADPVARGSFGVGMDTLTVQVDAERSLQVQAWYPTETPSGSSSLPEAFLSGAEAEAYAGLLDVAPADCPSLSTQATSAAPPAAGPHPLVLFSHCYGCTRFSSFTVAEHLASHGVVVLAPDHAGNTLLDELAGEELSLDTETLELRRDDLIAVLDAAEAGLSTDEAGAISLDLDHVATLGHSFGSVTAGYVAQDDPRVSAAFGLAAPMENPLLRGVDMAAFDKPLALLLAEEDHSIGALGNTLLESNAEAATGPTWLVRFADAGHWSVSDLVGLTEAFMPGCGSDTRQEGGEAFDYPDPAASRAATAAVVTAFMGEQLLGWEGAMEGLSLEGLSVEGP